MKSNSPNREQRRWTLPLRRCLRALGVAAVCFAASSVLEARTVYTNHNATFTWNGFCVLNNQWGRQQATNTNWYQRTVLEDDNTVSFEYNWDGSESDVKGYPVVMAGWHYGSLLGYRTPMGAWGLPSQVGSRVSYLVNAAVTHTNQGTYVECMNLSWDVWFGASSNPSAPTQEMMVWPWHTRQVPIGTLVATIPMWGATWDVYQGSMTSGGSTWSVVSYLRTSQTLNAGGNLRDFIADMRPRTGLATNAWVIGIEFGTEIMRGQGAFHVGNYSLETAPRLSIAQSDTNAVVSWNTNFTDFTLEGAGDLTGGWTTVPGVAGGSATLPISVTNQFFRLRQ